MVQITTLSPFAHITSNKETACDVGDAYNQCKTKINRVLFITYSANTLIKNITAT